MADVITRFRLETTQYDSKLRDAAKGLKEVVRVAELGGKDFTNFSQKQVEAARALGNTASGANNAKDRLKDLVGAFNDTAKAYNNLSSAQQQSDFGKALSQSLEQLQQRIKDTKQELYGLSSTVEDVKQKSGGGLFGEGGLTGMLQVAGGNLLAYGIQKLGSEIGETIQQSVELAKSGEGIRMAFDRLNRPDLLSNLKEATHGTVSELELMKAAVQFNDFKLPVEQLGTMLEFAQKKAKDTGQSVDYMVQSIVTGLGRKSLMILDNLGLSAAQIKEKMAETGDMTTAVASIIKEQMSEAGEYVETAADRAARAAADAQNQMEQLGRQAMPVAEQWSQTWLTIKTGALDLLNSAITPLINALTTAGRLRAAQQERGSQGRVAQQIAWLQNPGSEGKQSVYERINDSYVDEINHARTEYNKLRKDAIWNPFAAWNADKALANLNAIKQEFANFKAQATPIMKPSGNKIEVKTDEAVQSVDTLKKKLAELQEQRRNAIQSKDKGLSADLLKQINQVKSEIKGLDPNALKTGSTGTNPVKQAADKVASAQHEYAQSIEMAKMQLDNGTKTEAEYKKQLLSAEERLWNALGDAYQIHKDPKYKDAQDDCAANIKRLGGEVNASIEAQKKAQEAARELEQAQKKTAAALDKSAEAWRSGNLKGYMQAQKQVSGDVTPAIGSDAFRYTSENLDAFVGELKDNLSKADIGSKLYNDLSAQLADANALGNLIQTAIKNGIDVAEFNPQELWRKVFGDNPGDYISDETWENIRKKIEEIIGKPIKLNLKTGETTSGGRSSQKNNPYLKTREDGKTEASISGVLGGLGSGMSQMVNGIEQLGIDVPEGIKNAINAMQGISTILTGIATTVLAIEAIAGADAIIPFARGGMIKAFSGTLVGTTYSGDQLRGIDQSGQIYGLNAGEVVLNRAQVGNIASQLSGGMAAMQLSAIITGEQLRLVLNNNGRRTGRGEYVTTKFR